MVENITAKVLNMDRKLTKSFTQNLDQSDPGIRVISTFAADKEILDIVGKFSPNLSRTRSFSQSSSATGTTTPAENSPSGTKNLFKFVKRTGSCLRSKLVRVKSLAIGTGHV